MDLFSSLIFCKKTQPYQVNFTIHGESENSLPNDKEVITVIITSISVGTDSDSFAIKGHTVGDNKTFEGYYVTNGTKTGTIIFDEAPAKASIFANEEWLYHNSSILENDIALRERIIAYCTTIKADNIHLFYWAKANIKRRGLYNRGYKIAPYISFKDFIEENKLDDDKENESLIERVSARYLFSFSSFRRGQDKKTWPSLDRKRKATVLSHPKYDKDSWSWGKGKMVLRIEKAKEEFQAALQDAETIIKNKPTDRKSDKTLKRIQETRKDLNTLIEEVASVTEI